MDIVNFKPTRAQQLAKARFYKYLEYNPMIKLESLSVSAMEKACKSRSLDKWMGQEGFKEWWYDDNAVPAKIAACAELALERLYEILTSDIESGKEAKVTARDLLNAIDKVLELNSLYPNKQKEIRFLDKEIEKLDESSAITALQDIKLKLAKTE